MKIYSFIATTAIAALALAGCNKEQVTAPAANPDEGVKAVTLSIRGLNANTKAPFGQTVDASWVKDSGIDQLDIYFTSAGDQIQYAYRLDASGEYSEAWNAITATTGDNRVRFIGLKEVSRVYVVANYPDVLVTSGNMTQIVADLADMQGNHAGAFVTKTDVVYMGGDTELTPIGTEPADNVGAEVGEGEPASMYMTAVVTIRPVISRLEIEKISVVSTGTLEVPDPDNEEDVYEVTWEGFEPELVGVYMSNFYETLVPVTPTLGTLFATPEGQGIANGAWTGLDANYNKNGLAFYNNYSSTYEALFTDCPGTEGSKYVYFNGNSASCLPFNFLVPFDVESTAQEVNVEGSFKTPKFHFQFLFSQDDLAAYNITKVVNKSTQEEVTEDNNLDLYERLTAGLVFTTVTTDNIYYANVTSFFEDNSGTAGDPVIIKPNSIYRMSEVAISPFNLGFGTVSEEAQNVIVKVSVLPYNEVKVLPSFNE